MGWLDHMMKQLISLEIFLPFIPFFVAFDALGILPIFVSLTSEMTQPEWKKAVRQSTLTAFSQSRWIMRFLKEGGAKGIAKVASLLLAAFAVMMIRTGLAEWAGR
jgi:small neutral amino acid transporter SnatA (MarC family)